MLLTNSSTAVEVVTAESLRWKWRWEVAWLARGVIIQANRTECRTGRWPTKMYEWRRVARRLGLDLAMLKAGQQHFGARLLDDTVFLELARPEQLARWIAHEVTEAVLRRECGVPPVVYPWEAVTDECHIVAGLVEHWERHRSLLDWSWE